MSRSNVALVACLAVLASACGVDRATGPDGNAALAAMANDNPSPLTVAAGAVELQVSLYWVDNSPNETGFEIHRALGTAGTFAAIASTAAKVTSYADWGRQATTTYCYKVRAFRSAGNKTTYSGFSNSACATTASPPPAPANVTATPGNFSDVVVAWSASPNASSYRVDRAASPAGPWETIVPSVADLQITDHGRQIEQQVCYRIGATNSVGTTLSAARCTTPPAAPTDAAVSAPAGGGLDIRWVDASSAEDGFEVQRAVSDFLFTVIATTPANATSYHDAAVTLDTRYWYRVRARKDGGFSLFSQWADGVSATALPDAPTSFATFPSGSNAVWLAWASTATNGLGFRIERSLNGAPYEARAVTSWSDQQFRDTEAPGDAENCYRVVAFNSKGDSPPTPADCSRPIKAPTEFAGVPAGPGEVDLAWADNSAYETAYEVHRLDCSGYGYYGYQYCYIAESYSLPAGATSLHVTGLSENAVYQFEIIATAFKNGELYYSDLVQTYAATGP